MMINRRRILATGVASGAWAWGRSVRSERAEERNGLLQFLTREHGDFDLDAYRKLLGAANDYKEGDAIVGVSAKDSSHRALARELLANALEQDIGLSRCI